MTTRNKASLTLLFEQADTPSGNDFADFVDSYVNVAETSAQTILSSLKATEFIASRVSATNANFTGTVSANAINTGSINIGGDISGSGVIVASAARITGNVSAASGNISGALNVGGDISSSGLILGSKGIVSAAGTTQGAAASLAFYINQAKGVTDGSATGFALPANKSGLIQIIYNDAASANLWPPTGGAINALGANTVFPLAANTMYTIAHIGASAYAVK